MLRIIVNRLLLAVPVLLGVTVLVFLILHSVPGDPVATYYGIDLAPGDDLETMRHELGLDRPLYVQYLDFLWKAVHGDLGNSIKTRRPVLQDLSQGLLNTAQLATVSILIAIVVGMFFGVLAAYKPYSIWDNISLTVSLFGISLPVFWIGLLLIWLMAVKLAWLPPGGIGDWRNLVLPALTLSLPSIAVISRVTRASLLEILNEDYIRTARSKGLSGLVIMLRHTLPNGIFPVITVIGLQFGYLLGGTVLTETVFSWPGMGRYVVDAIKFRDYPVVQGGVLIVATIFVVVNLLVDILYYILNPRLRTGEQS
jgi:peptide/nickel transport system permease protein